MIRYIITWFHQNFICNHPKEMISEDWHDFASMTSFCTKCGKYL